MYLLLPYIDDKNDFELFKQIFRLSDITCKKRENKDKSVNNYVISNFQYSRYININIPESYKKLNIHQSFSENNEPYYEYSYNRLDLLISFKLVLNTIEQINDKLYQKI